MTTEELLNASTELEALIRKLREDLTDQPQGAGDPQSSEDLLLRSMRNHPAGGPTKPARAPVLRAIQGGCEGADGSPHANLVLVSPDTAISGEPALARLAFTASEVAAALGISLTVVRDMTVAGVFPCRRLGRSVRYTRADIDAFLDAHSQKGNN